MLEVTEKSVEDASAATPRGDEPGSPAHVSRWRLLLPDALWMTATAGLALGVAVWLLELWRANLRVPWMAVNGDMFPVLTQIKGMLEHGWVWTNPSIGAPDGMQWYDAPVGFGDTLHFTIMKAMGVVSSDPVAVMNAFYLLGFPLAAATAFGVMRALGLGRGPAMLGGVLFAVLPFHWVRGEAHLTLSSYYAVPLGAWLVFGAAGLHPLFTRRDGDERRIRGWLTGRTVATLVICVVVAIATLYWALFALVILTIVGLVMFAARRRVGELVQTGVVIVLVFGVAVLQQLPAIIYALQHGRNLAAGTRVPQESELYGLKLASMVLPRFDHRVDALAAIGQKYVNTTPSPSEGFSASLGLLMTVGLFGSVLALLVYGLRRTDASRTVKMLVASGVASLLTFLMATIGGGSAVFSYMVSPQIRGWNRISVFIAFFAVVALAALLTALGRRLADRRGRTGTAVFGIGLAVLGVIGVLDQTTPANTPQYPGMVAMWRNDQRFADAITAVMPKGSKILELPYAPFPESPPVNDMADYDLLRPYVHDRKGLQWSYGDIKGRPEDWVDDASRLPARTMLDAAVAAGFRGVYIDRFGYKDRGVRILRELERMTGEQPLNSADGRFAFVSLIDYARTLEAATTPAARAAAGAALTHPVTPQAGEGFHDPEIPAPGTTFWWGEQTATLELLNRDDRTRRVALRLQVTGAGPPGRRTRIRISAPGAVTRTIVADGNERSTYRALVTVPADGTADVRFEADGPRGESTPADDRVRYLRMYDPTVTDPDLARFARETQR